MDELEKPVEVFINHHPGSPGLRLRVTNPLPPEKPEPLEPGRPEYRPPAVDVRGNLARLDTADARPVLTGKQYAGQIDLANPLYKQYWDAGGNWIGEPGGIEAPVMWRMERFVQEYLIDYNASRAALAVGFETDGGQLKRELAPIIRLRAATIAGRCGVTAERVIKEYAKMAFSNIQDYIGSENMVKDISELDQEKTSAIESLTVKRKHLPWEDGGELVQTQIKMCSKQSALEALGRHLGMFNADTTHKAENKAPVIILFGDEKHVSITQPKPVNSQIIDAGDGAGEPNP